MDSPELTATPESRLHFLDYWRIIRIRKGIIISVFLITTLIATFVTFLMRPSFSSTAQVRIEPDTVSDVPTIGEGSGAYVPYDPYFMETEQKAILGQDVLTRVIDRLNLDDVWGKKFNNGVPFKTSETLSILRGQISLAPERNTKIIDISVISDDKDEAAIIANTIAEAYKNYRLEQHTSQMTNGISMLDQDLQNEEVKITMMQSNVDYLRTNLNIHDTDPNSMTFSPTINNQSVQNLSERLIEDEADYMKLNNEYMNLLSLQETNPAEMRDVLPTTANDDILSGLLSKLNDNEQAYVAETNHLGQANPEVLTTKSLIETLNRQIDDRVAGIMITLKNRVDGSQMALVTLSNRLQQVEDTDNSEANRGAPYWEAKQNLASERSVRDLLAAKIESDKADAVIPKTALVKSINPASPNPVPVRPKKTLYISIAAFMGLLVGICLAFFIEYLDTSVKTIDEVERVFQTPVLGVIPQNVGILMEQGMDSSHAEAYRVLRTNILFSRKDENFNSLVVISAGMGEGKSTTVLNLATVFAQAGQRTLVVDSDLRRPTLHKLLKLSNNAGLINFLLKQNTLEEVIQTTAVPMLDFLASGKLPGGSMNILGSGQMKSLISELKQRYDFILFDSPPIMGLSDASVLASEIDMAVQIIQYRRYPQLMNIRAKQMVEKVGGNLVGIVLNNINMAQDESYYYYGGYYYHANEESGAEPSKTSPGDGERVGIQKKY
ncbi:MAG TPA: polysaccharide biosynthesis tyrosine autokinase [Pseudomonadales bacterium]|nr:polysaccharide biosynthesis tyrosine autokinase [Pseudomonadales bacterium]